VDTNVSVAPFIYSDRKHLHKSCRKCNVAAEHLGIVREREGKKDVSVTEVGSRFLLELKAPTRSVDRNTGL
jgi:hypothetical protein